MSGQNEAHQVYRKCNLRRLVGDVGRRLGVGPRKSLDANRNGESFAAHWNGDNHLLFEVVRFKGHEDPERFVTPDTPFTDSGFLYMARGVLYGKRVSLHSKVWERCSYSVVDDWDQDGAELIFENHHGFWCRDSMREYSVKRSDQEPFWFVVPSVVGNGSEE